MAWDVVNDSQGYAYVVGHTTSTDFPSGTTTHPTLYGSEDVFITKYSPNADRILYTTILGGSSVDRGMGIDLDNQGNVWVTGYTYSTNFPVVNGFQTTLAGGKDAFVARLKNDGTSVTYSSYLGGSANDDAAEIAIDTSNNAYIYGTTYSTNVPTKNAVQATAQGLGDTLLAKFNGSLTGASSLVYSTYLGGNNDEWGYGIDVDGSGNAYVTGFTKSTNLPVVNAYQATFGGDRDGYVLKVAATGGSILYGTYLGGSGFDEGINLSIHSNGDYYVVGKTTSTNFPVVSPRQATNGGGMDAWVTKFSATNTILYSTYHGGTGEDAAAAVVVQEGSQEAFVTGYTKSTNFPLGPAVQYANGGLTDAFVTRFNKFGSTIINGTYYGGSGDDWADGIAVDYASNAYIVGATTSDTLPVVNAQQAQRKAGNDAFLALIDPDDYFLLTPGVEISYRTIQPSTDIDTYNVDLQAGKEVIIRMSRMSEATGLNGYLTLLDPTGRAVASDNDRGGNGNAKINRFIVPTTGRYQVQVKDYAGTRTGFYRLSVTVNTPATPPPPAPPAGQDVDPCPAPTTPTSLPTEDPVARGPENADFEQAVTELPRTTYPVNCDFSQLAQISTTTISPVTLSTPSGTSTQSTANFVVPPTVQSVHFQYLVGEQEIV